MAPIDRTHMLHVRISKDEHAMLRALAERDGVTASDFLRLFVRRAYVEAFGERLPKKPKK